MSSHSAGWWGKYFDMSARDINERLRDSGYEFDNTYETPEWDPDVIDDILEYDMGRIDWYCDECGEFLNDQDDFEGRVGYHTCTECGHENHISASELKGC